MKKTFFLLFAILPATLHAANAERLDIGGHAQMYKANGNVNNNWCGGGTVQSQLFDGNTTVGLNFPYDGRGENNMYMVFTLSDILAGGYYVTQVIVWQQVAHQYSLYYSTDGGANYEPVAGGVGVSDANAEGAAYGVDEICTHVKIVFNKLTGWSPGTSEIEVWGIDPSEMGCTHRSCTAWQPVAGTETCTLAGIVRRTCLDCGEQFEQRSSDYLPALGHDYVSSLARPGISGKFGSGTITCSRCDWYEVFNIPFDLTLFGGVEEPGKVQFSNLSVSSEWHPEWEGGVGCLVDGNWTLGGKSYWAAASRSHDEYVDFKFGTEIDLTGVDFSVPNRNHSLDFYKVEGGVETLIGTAAVSAVSGGNHQRKSIAFRGVSLDHLRVRVSDSVGTSHFGKNVIEIAEMHPYGTVKGAGLPAVLQSKILLY